MSQTIILDNLAAYFRIKYPNQTQTLQAEFAKEGRCFSFALCFGAMADPAIDQEEWWVAVLVAIANWDENPATLSRRANLPGKKKYTLATIFERAANYLLTNQGEYHVENFDLKIEEYDQFSFLDPAKHYFEVVDRHDQIRYIKSTNAIAGYFTAKQLLLFLNENTISSNICLIGSTSHVIRVGYKNSTWMLYDSNYSHLSRKTIQKIFPSRDKKKVVKEIISILGNSLVIKVTSFNKKEIVFSEYDALSDDEIIGLLEEYGLHQILQHCPERLLKILAIIQESPKKIKNIHPQISRFFPEPLLKILLPAPQPMIGVDKICQALSTQNKMGATGLKLIAKNMPVQLPLVLALVAAVQDGHNKIAEALILKDSIGFTGLSFIAIKTPVHLPLILGLAAEAIDGANKIAGALITQNNKGTTGFQVVLNFAPTHLPLALTLAAEAVNGHQNISQLLVIQNKNGCTGLQLILISAPAHLPLFLKLAASAIGGHDKIAEALTIQDNSGLTGLHMIALFAPEYLSLILKLTVKAQDGPNKISRALATQDDNGYTGLHMIADMAPEHLPLAVELSATAQDGPERIAQALVMQDENGRTGLQAIAQCAPSYLKRSIELAMKASCGFEKIITALAKKNQEGETGRHAVKRVLPDYNEFIIPLCLKKIKSLDQNTLIRLDDEVSKALTQPDSNLYGLCERRPSLFFKSHGKTTMWKTLSVALNTEVSERQKNIMRRH